MLSLVKDQKSGNMSLQSWSTSTDPAEECQKACDEASAMLQQLSRSELQNFMDDSEAFNRLISDMEKVIFRLSSVHDSWHSFAAYYNFQF